MAVQEILGRIGLSMYCHVFEKNEFDFDAFMKLEDKDFKELHIPLVVKTAIKEEIQRINLRKTLEGIGLDKYGHVFEENGYNFDALLNVNDKRLKELNKQDMARLKVLDILYLNNS